MPRPRITVTLITLNEEKNLARALKSVAWADEKLVIDSGSTDRTVEIAREHGAHVIQNPWPGYGRQKNFAQDHAANEWILNLDADEEVSSDLHREIVGTLDGLDGLDADRRVASGFEIPRRTWFLGRWILHGGWYPNHLVRLVDRRRGRWTEPQVHEAWKPFASGEASIARLTHPLLHYTFASIREQVLTNLRFSNLGFQELQRRGKRASLAKLVLKPIGKFLETYLVKRGFLDGLPGLIISVNAAHSMFLKYAYFFEAEIPTNENPHRR